ncbi:MAG: DUF169 domain-containing protein [Fervidicoccaceae archaeon]
MDFSYAQRRLMEILKLKSYPIGLRLLVDGEQPQEDAIRPLRDIKHNISMCQAFTIARREGKVIAMMKEDNWCFAPVISYGMPLCQRDSSWDTADIHMMFTVESMENSGQETSFPT